MLVAPQAQVRSQPRSFTGTDFWFMENGSQQPQFYVSALTYTSVVPAPLAGAGLPGLVAACGGLIVLARRRRQQIA